MGSVILFSLTSFLCSIPIYFTFFMYYTGFFILLMRHSKKKLSGMSGRRQMEDRIAMGAYIYLAWSGMVWL